MIVLEEKNKDREYILTFDPRGEVENQCREYQTNYFLTDRWNRIHQAFWGHGKEKEFKISQ